MRLDKLLASSGFGSRADARKLIKSGTVAVDGKTVTDPAFQVTPEKNTVTNNSAPVAYKEFLYFIMNKPAGVISATEGNEKTVLDLLPENLRGRGLFPVGRLDKDTIGLLLITDDGLLAHNMLAPKKHVAKIYRAKVGGLLTEEDVQAFRKGISLGDFICQSAKLTIVGADENESEALVEISEGKFHQVKRMFEAVNKYVNKLERVTFGPLTLPEDLREGEFRELTEEEAAKLRGRR